MKLSRPVILTTLAAAFAAAVLPLAGAPAKTAKPAAAVSRQQSIAPEYLKPGGSRKFSIEYVGKVPEVPAGTKKLRVWMPVPQNSTVQTITELKFPQKPKLTTEPKYGNRIAYWEISKPEAAVELKMSFTCEHKEVTLDIDRLRTDDKETANFDVFLKPDKLVLVDDEMRKLSGEVTAGKTSTIDKAKAIYDHVLTKMTYDKNHEGWGQGSTRHACDVGKGNCTDFHALFNSLCRAQGIASGFEIGLYLPYEKGKVETPGGYHCWAFFRVPGKTWVPVDCSEADRFPERRDTLFGGHTSNRVALSTGRDLTLEPKQAGEPLNYFLNPYAEADGKPVKAEKTWSYKDLE
jgi:transglutaminase-like putative cysteine protease